MEFVRIPDPDLIPQLLQEFPEFRPRWEEHLAWWKGEAAGSYNDMREFVDFVIEDLYVKGEIERVRHAFSVLEDLFVAGNQHTRDVIGYGFFESLRNAASWEPFGNKAFEPFLGPMSQQVWLELEEMWRGKSSLMEVIRAERKNQRE